MIKQMRIKIVIITMSALLILLLSIFVFTNVYMRRVAMNDTDAFLENLISNDGMIKNPMEDLDFESQRGSKPPEPLPAVSGISLRLTKEGEIEQVLLNTTDATEDIISEYVKSILSANYDEGNIDIYRYRIKESDSGYILVLADTSIQDGLLVHLLTLSIVISSISFSVLFVIIIFLSRYITKPVEEAMEKQKRFIADSSHELKTPLSIMSVNLEMLEMEIGNNSRISAISDGIKRMNNLIHELLLLARTEQKSYSKRRFNISQVMESTILPMEVVAYEQGKRIVTDIEEEVSFVGDEEGIRKMIGALMENALKYSREKTSINARLYSKGDFITIEIYNEGIGVTKDQKEKLFDKFYRVDDSRQRETGGHGIGLSIVQSIVDMHKGKIIVKSVPNEYIVFKIILPRS